MFQMPATGCGGEWGEWQTPVQRPTTPTLDKQKVRDFIDRNGGGRGGRLHVEKAQSFLTVVITLVISGLTSAILVVLGTVHLQFQVRVLTYNIESILILIPGLWKENTTKKVGIL